MNNISLNEIIVNSAITSIQFQTDDGWFPPGHNGSYKDPETPVRNTAHWCITLLKSFEISGEQLYLDAAIRCGAYLLSDEARPMNSVFFCRKNPEKDFANGLIGQAWTIEALAELYKVTNEPTYNNLAVKVFLMHPFDDSYRAWVRRNVDGSYNGFDGTFNHQLWFAAAGGMLSQYDQTIQKKVLQFMDYLDEHLNVYPDGCVMHKGKFLCRSTKENAFHYVKKLLQKKETKSYMRMKSVGYHGFNLYAFALLKHAFPDHPFFSSDKLKRALQFAASDNFKKKVAESKYGFPYNPPGFEMAYAFQTFNTVPETEIDSWVSWQIEKCFDFETNLMTKGGTYDKITSAARIYEATRLNNYPLIGLTS